MADAGHKTLKAELHDLTLEEQRELSWERTQAWLKDSGDVKPFTPEEARWHAKEFIAHNGPYNLVRLLAEAFLALQDEVRAA